jgi:hypothetical protein
MYKIYGLFKNLLSCKKYKNKKVLNNIIQNNAG